MHRFGFVLFLGYAGFAGDGIPSRFPPAPRIVAIGDLHGDLAATRRALRLAGAIDESDRWIGGDLVVVQTGDQLDRGDQERAILELLDRLATEAAAQGGALHALNGNHELMNVALDLRYVTPGGYEDFEDMASAYVDDPELADFPAIRRGRVAAFRPGGPYAKLLECRNTAVIVGENVFAHGGVLPEHLAYGLEKMNSEIRLWLSGEVFPPKENPFKSLVWDRRYSLDTDEAACQTLHRVLQDLGAKRMIVGHTVQTQINSACDGAVWRIDVGMAAHYRGPTTVLEIVGDRIRVLP